MILIVDDNIANLAIAKKAFEKEHEVVGVTSGEQAIDYIQSRKPELILLDHNMPDMDGEQTFDIILSMEEYRDIPVVFMTANSEASLELDLLKKGAMDFIRKPFIPEIARARVNHILTLERYQRFLADEVEIKTRELNASNKKVKRLSNEIILALSTAIESKDRYTRGHSNRVAEYSREIALRIGKSDKEADDIYYAAMLHDVGKIGIPNEIINKPGKLSKAEFAIIQEHTENGARILMTIDEMPELSVGAHWHHERYDGKGYPDGLAGEEIPELARIICVADCYDAMTSNRSYRKALSQEQVRKEFVNGRGTQFDPRMADVMIGMIDEDRDYEMRERTEGELD